VKYTSAHPFTPEFVQGHLKKGHNNNTSRARTLYDQRVRRRQIGLVERKDKKGSQSQREKKEKAKAKAGKEDIARVRARMGRREAAEKGVWRLRADEARYVMLDARFFTLQLSLFFGFLLKDGMRLCRCIGCGLGICLSYLDWDWRRCSRRRAARKAPLYLRLRLPRHCLNLQERYMRSSSKRTFTAQL
jgi:hypothetical protein